MNTSFDRELLVRVAVAWSQWGGAVAAGLPGHLRLQEPVSFPRPLRANLGSETVRCCGAHSGSSRSDCPESLGGSPRSRSLVLKLLSESYNSTRMPSAVKRSLKQVERLRLLQACR